MSANDSTIQPDGSSAQLSPGMHERALLFHELQNGLSTLGAAVGGLRELIKELAPVLSKDQEEFFVRYVDVIDYEIEDQQFAAQNFLAHVFPNNADLVNNADLSFESPSQVLLETIWRYERRAHGKQIEFEIEPSVHELKLPPIRIAKGHLTRAFHNVLSNAIKYSNEGAAGESRSIRIRAKRHDAERRFFALEFQNYGVGIEPHELRKVFTPGFRGTAAIAGNRAGCGLGLAEVRRVMHLHGGRAHIDSSLLRGQTFLTTVVLVFPSTTRLPVRSTDV